MSYFVPKDIPKYCNDCPFGHLHFQHPWDDKIRNGENNLKWGFGCNLLLRGVVAKGDYDTDLPKPFDCPLRATAINISIYDHYKIKHTYTYSYSIFDYDDLQTRTETEECEMDGGEFLGKVIAKSIQDREFSGIAFGGNLVTISFFDPTSGHASDHIYELQEVFQCE